GEPELAEHGYRSALHETWLFLGSIELAENRPDAAETAFLAAGDTILDDRRARRALASLYQHSDRAADAIRILRRLIARHPDDVELRRSLAHTLFADGKVEEAIGELRESYVARPEDPEAAFILATAYLKAERPEEAEALFQEIVKARPIPQTHLLLGRTLRDFKQLEAAQVHLEKALDLDPNLPRARFYLGTLALYSQGRTPYEEAVRLFEHELRLLAELGRDPDADTTTHLFLGLTLAEIRRFEEAIPHLRIAAGDPASSRDAFHNLGRCLLELDRIDESIAAFEQALTLAEGAAFDQLTSLHYQFAKALRRQGRMDQAKVHFEAAKQSSGNLALDNREQLKRYLADRPETEVGTALPQLTTPELRQMPTAERQKLKRSLVDVLCRAYLNLGIMQTRKQRFAAAIR
ncbi:Transmembrane and TPR repeat-containing protein 4, partial [Exaiptasia diaphana]